VPGYDPDISAELYTTNGDTDAHMEAQYGTLGFTPEMSTCATAAASDPDDAWVPEDCVSIFTFPAAEALLQAEFAKNLPFALAVGQSALDPDDPVSVVGSPTGLRRPVHGRRGANQWPRSPGAPQEVRITTDQRRRPISQGEGGRAASSTAIPMTSTTPSCAVRSGH
jgi:hypothetical protein